MLHYTESGAGAPPVVLLHAFPMDSALWTHQRRGLAAAGFRVVTPDLPGFGGSALSRERPSLDAMADEVAELLGVLGIERAVVGGLSMGGYVTMALLRRHPALVSAVILADTKASADGPEAVATRLAMADKVLIDGTAGLGEGMVVNLLGATTHATRPEVVRTVIRWVSAQPASAIAWAQRAMAERPDSHADLAAFPGPVLVLQGSEDVIAPEPEVRTMAAAVGSGAGEVTVVEVPGAGHLSAIEDPDAVTTALVDWLRTL